VTISVPTDWTGPYRQCRTELGDALLAWDFSQAFHALNPSYTGSATVEVVENWPDVRIDQLQQANNGMMTKPIISLVLGHTGNDPRSLGSISNLPTTSPPADGMKRIATRVTVGILVSCWADMQLGGYGMVEALAGHCQACVFANQRTLATFRHLRVHNDGVAYEDRPGVVTIDLVVQGDAIMSIDVPDNY